MEKQELLSGQLLLNAIEESGKDRFPDLPEDVQDSIEANVTVEDRLRGLSFVKNFLRKEIADKK
ncbi:MAG: hypothetical protein ACNFW9_04985 [Candidatus Kerfeldbacteria bacterium]